MYVVRTSPQRARQVCAVHESFERGRERSLVRRIAALATGSNQSVINSVGITGLGNQTGRRVRSVSTIEPIAVTQEQRDHLRHRLQAERERVVAALARFGERAVEADRRAEEHAGAPFHSHEADGYNQALDALEISRLSRVLAEIVSALKLLDEAPDRYGVDEQTGEPIPLDQLDKIPWARSVRPHEDATDLLAADPDVLRAYRNERYSG